MPGWFRGYDVLVVVVVVAGLAALIAGVVITLARDDRPEVSQSDISPLFREQAVPAGDLLVVVDLFPGTAGANQVSVLIADADSAPVTPKSVEAVITGTDGNQTLVPLQMLHAGEHYVAEGVMLAAGAADVQVTIVRPGEPTVVGLSEETVDPAN